MLIWYRVLILSVVSYFFGNVNFARIIAAARHLDITKKGSGNPGTMNMVRVLGIKFGIMTLVLDALKAVVPCVLGGLFLLPRGAVNPCPWFPGLPSVDGVRSLFFLPGVYIAGIAVIVGHMYPVVYLFRGGKSVASAIGFFIVCDWRFALLTFVIVAAIFFLFRYASVASLCFVVVMTALEYVKLFVWDSGGGYTVLLAILLAAVFALIMFAHRHNIQKILTGRENKISDVSFVKKADPDEKKADSGETGGGKK